ncbi:MAG: glycosyltransferase family 39 protein [Cyanobacteria bacterium Co-bin13]|nr:glycosyltransferase family 39 protein [Cyanobacteria bacterium Co-bin13]
MSKSTPKLADDGRDLAILGGVWLLATLGDGLWLWLDQAPPAWDQGEHLTRALNHWGLFQAPALTEESWWQSLWRLSPTYRAPFVYLMTVPLLEGLGRGFDQAVLVNSVFNALLLLLTYSLGRRVFDRQTGLWAAIVSTFVPVLLLLRVDYLLDYGLIVCVLAGFFCLTAWRSASPIGRWGWALGFGVSFGLTLLTKPTGILFLLLPMAWIAVETLLKRRWYLWLQWGLAALVALAIFWPWFQTNWITILSTSGKSNATWIAAELDLESPWSVWTYYLRMLPRMITPALLWAGLGGWILGLGLWKAGLLKSTVSADSTFSRRKYQWLWLLSYVVGTYGLLSLLQNKDPRHIVPYVPMVVILLVRGLTAWTVRGWSWLKFALVGVMAIFAVSTLFPVSYLPLSQLPQTQLAKHPYRGSVWPHSQLIETVLTTAPYLRSTVGVLPNVAELNPMNVDFYGALRDFRVFGREVGFSPDYAPLDARSLTWVVTKSGEQGPQNSGNEAKADLQTRVEQSPDYQAVRTWPLPDNTEMTLYHRQPAPVEVIPLTQSQNRVSLTGVEAPATATANSTVPVSYTLQGPWEALADGLLILTWQAEVASEAQPAAQWIHDHGIGLGNLDAGLQSPSNAGFTVTERLGMVVPANVQPGRYRLIAEYFNRQTGEAYPLPTANAAIAITPGESTLAGPEPDLVSQLYGLSQGLAEGSLDPIFNTVGRINQYDPLQDYLKQAEQAMGYRLEQAPAQLEWLYTRVMAQVLQQKAESAIATLDQITALAPSNPYHWLYLGFVHLYRWHPHAAERALDQAARLAPDLPELKALQAVAALQRLNLPRAWRLIQTSGLL